MERAINSIRRKLRRWRADYRFRKNHRQVNSFCILFTLFIFVFILHRAFRSDSSKVQERWRILVSAQKPGIFGAPNLDVPVRGSAAFSSFPASPNLGKIMDLQSTRQQKQQKGQEDEEDAERMMASLVHLCNGAGLCSNWGMQQLSWSHSELQNDEAWPPVLIKVPAGFEVVLTMVDESEKVLRYGEHHCDDSVIKCQDILDLRVQESIRSAILKMQQVCDQDDWKTQPKLLQTIRPRIKPAARDVSLIAQFSVNRLDRFENAIRHWPGPISAVIYLQNHADVVPLGEYFAQSSNLDLYRQVTLTIVKPDYSEGDHEKYPINYLRNIGIQTALTDYIFLIDADFVPTTKLHGFAKNTVIGLLEKTSQPTAYVVPCVAIHENYREEFPDSIEELQKLMAKKIAYITDPRAGHGPTLTSLFMNSNTVFGRSRRPAYEVCYESQWEPYYIVKRQAPVPFYDERFKNQGGDKQSHALLMNALGFKFLVLRDHFMYHLDHGKLVWAGGGLEANQAKEQAFTYFKHYLPAMSEVFGVNVRWPRGCSKPLISSSKLDLQGLGTM